MPRMLFLRLEGPLQSWGERAHWELRDTATEPTKSGMVGLLSCALGLKADADIAQLSRSLRFGVRCDRPGVLIEDYHTVIGGVMSASGKVKRNATTKKPETVVSHRQYLCDASFLVAVQSDDTATIGRLAAALDAPYWPPYLGRRSCSPSVPLLAGTGDYSTLEDALNQWPRAANSARQPLLRAVIECQPGEGVRRNHEIVSRSRRWFGLCYTREVAVSPPFCQEVSSWSSRG